MGTYLVHTDYQVIEMVLKQKLKMQYAKISLHETKKRSKNGGLL